MSLDCYFSLLYLIKLKISYCKSKSNVAVLCRLLVLLSIFAGFVANANAQVIDRVLVLINDDVITESEFVSELRRRISELQATKQQLPDQSAIEHSVMEGMILERIQLQIADAFNLTVSDSQIDRAMEDIAGRQNLSVLELLERVRASGLNTEEYRQELTRQIKIQRVIDREVRRRIVVTDREVDMWLSTQSSDEESDIKYEVAHISLNIVDDSEASIAEAIGNADRIVEALQSGSKFDVLARRHSDSGDADNGGYLGWRSKNELPDIFYETVSELEIDQISKVIRSSGGVHILKLLDRRGGGRFMVDQWNARHILIAVNTDTTEKDAIDQAERLRERLLQDDEFETLANVHSDDGQSRFKGGDLGWLSPGDTVPEFEEALRNLPLNKVSQPVQTRYGVHLIELLERRQRDIGADRLRTKAEQALREQKGLDAFEQWKTRIREEAYVKFRVKPQG